jgi:hypothetical protein
MAHGFVPHENPNTCASILGATFLRGGSAAVGRNYKEGVGLQYLALKELCLIHPSITKLEALDDVCVKENLEIVNNDYNIGWKPALDSIAITTIILGNGHDLIWKEIEVAYGETCTTLRDKCILAIKLGDRDRIEVRCMRYPKIYCVVKDALREAARWYTKSSGERGNVGEENVISQLQEAVSRGRDKLALALQFHIEEKKILNRIVHFKDDDDVTCENCINDQKQVDSSKSRDNPDRKLSAFTVLVESLGLPVNKIEPKLVGNGMRVGAFTTEDLNVDNVYIALPANSVIDVNTALADADKSFWAHS